MYENTRVSAALDKLLAATPSDRIGCVAILFEHWNEGFIHADGFKDEHAARDAGHPYFTPYCADVENPIDIAFACVALYKTLTTPRANSTPDVAEAFINDTPELASLTTAFYKLPFIDKKRYLIGLFGLMQSADLFRGIKMPLGNLELGEKNGTALLEHMWKLGEIDSSEYERVLRELDDLLPF